MRKETPVHSLMTKNIVVANLNHKLSQVQELFLNHNVHHLPVVYDDKLIGIISSTDLFRHYAEKGQLDDSVSIEEVMTRRPVHLAPNDPIKKAAQIFTENSFHALPVVEEGEVVGMVTNNDLVRYLHAVYENM